MTGETKKCPYCGGEILADAVKCRHCREFLNGLRQVEPTTEQRWQEKTSVKIVVATVLVSALTLFVLGSIHTITGSNLDSPFRIEYKDSFGLSETFINIDKITGMPWIFAKAKYPIACRVLSEHGYIESDEAFEARTRRECAEAMAKASEEFTAAIAKTPAQKETPLNNAETEGLRRCQIAYGTDVGLAAAGISLGEFLDRLSHSPTSTPLLAKSDDGRTVLTIADGAKTVRLVFACDASRGVCAITGGEIDNQEIASGEALGVMMGLASQ